MRKESYGDSICADQPKEEIKQSGLNAKEQEIKRLAEIIDHYFSFYRFLSFNEKV